MEPTVATLAPAKPTKEMRQQASRRLALAVLGGRFPGGVKEGLEHADFKGVASRYYTTRL